MFPEEGVVWSDELSLVCIASQKGNRAELTNLEIGQMTNQTVHLDYVPEPGLNESIETGECRERVNTRNTRGMYRNVQGIYQESVNDELTDLQSISYTILWNTQMGIKGSLQVLLVEFWVPSLL